MKSQTIVMADMDKLLQAMDQKIEEAFKKHGTNRQHSKYVTAEIARKTLDIGITKLQQLRNNDEIVFTRNSDRGFLYLYSSLVDYLDRNVVK